MEIEEKEQIAETQEPAKKSFLGMVSSLLSVLFHPFGVALYAYILLFCFYDRLEKRLAHKNPTIFNCKIKCNFHRDNIA